MSAEEDRSGRAVEEPGPYNMANRTFENVTIIPLIAPKDSFGQTFEKLNPIPAWGGLEHWPVRVSRAIIVDVIFHIEVQPCQTHPFDISCLLVQEKGPHAEGAENLGY
jgi:hypothetical protein